jgi:hypothetical protein
LGIAEQEHVADQQTMLAPIIRAGLERPRRARGEDNAAPRRDTLRLAREQGQLFARFRFGAKIDAAHIEVAIRCAWDHLQFRRGLMKLLDELSAVLWKEAAMAHLAEVRHHRHADGGGEEQHASDPQGRGAAIADGRLERPGHGHEQDSFSVRNNSRCPLFFSAVPFSFLPFLFFFRFPFSFLQNILIREKF